jgi:hypothetical protein
VDPSTGVLSQFLGNAMPENPPVMGMILMLRQVRHMAVTWVARELSVDAPITIPGIRTNFPMKSDYKRILALDFYIKIVFFFYVKISDLDNIGV